MRLNLRSVGLRLVVAALASAATLTGCGVGTYSYYDPYYHDYHRWDRAEAGYYRQWEVGSHRSHMDFRRRSPAEQHEYMNSRHH
jgi:hypothetical protein